MGRSFILLTTLKFALLDWDGCFTKTSASLSVLLSSELLPCFVHAAISDHYGSLNWSSVKWTFTTTLVAVVSTRKSNTKISLLCISLRHIPKVWWGMYLKALLIKLVNTRNPVNVHVCQDFQLHPPSQPLQLNVSSAPKNRPFDLGI